MHQPVIPFAWLEGFLDCLAANRDLFETLTYDDLPWGADHDGKASYPDERRAWQAQLADGSRDPDKIYLLLQHDVDDAPERTVALLRAEERLGLRSSVFLFHRHVDEPAAAAGRAVGLPYDIPHDYFGHLHRAFGFVFGYHVNAMQAALYDPDRAARLAVEDVRALGRHFPLRFYVPHGGVPGPGGENNQAIDWSAVFGEGLRCVYNPRSPRLDGAFSDGGLIPRSAAAAARPAEAFDLAAFLRSLRPGRRYRVLIHPQYYGDDWTGTPRLADAPWYRAVDRLARAGGVGVAWHLADIARAPPAPAARPFRLARTPFDRLAVADGPPVMVHGFARSGTTLLLTMLEAHPAVAMLYDAAEHRLRPAMAALDGARVAAIAEAIGAADAPDAAAAVEPALGYLVRTLWRSGIDRADLACLLRQHAAAGQGLDTPEARRDLVERLGRFKMMTARKRRWGSRSGFPIHAADRAGDPIAGAPETTRRLWPGARIVCLVRDPRDVFASLIDLGWWSGSASAFAQRWAALYASPALADPTVEAAPLIVRYEDLAADPAAVAARLTAFVGIDPDPGMLEFCRRDDLAVFGQPDRAQARLRRPIDTDRVGRHADALDPETIARITTPLAPLLHRYGYPA